MRQNETNLKMAKPGTAAKSVNLDRSALQSNDCFVQPLMFGPFLSPNGKTGEICPEIVHCGYDLEFATAKRSFRVSIYRRVVGWRADRINLEDYVFHEHDAPVDVM